MVSVRQVEIYGEETYEETEMPGLFYVDVRVKAKIEASSADCWITIASVSICDGNGCVDGPYEMYPDPSLGTNWYSSGVISTWGVLEPGDQISAEVSACEECWSEACANDDSNSVTVPSPSSPAPIPVRAMAQSDKSAARKKKAARRKKAMRKKKRAKKK